MVRGLYTGASAMLVYALRQDLLANDLANAQTVAYRPEDAPVSAFPEMLIHEELRGMRVVRGNAGTGAYLERSFTRWSATGGYRFTGRALDLALEGDGFFVVQTPWGLRLTRAGQFHVDGQGYLVNADGYPVLGTTGFIYLGDVEAERVVVTREGYVYGSQGELLGEILVVDVPDRQGLVREGGGLYRYTDASGQPVRVQAAIQQGMLENSATSVVRTMVDMISAVRAYQAAQVVVRTHDELTGELIQRVAATG